MSVLPPNGGGSVAADSAETRNRHVHRSGAALIETIAALGVIQLFAMALNAGRSKVVALTVGLSGVGAISVIDQLAALIMTISAFGLPFAALKYLSASISVERRTFEEQYDTFVWMVAILSALGTIVGLVAVFFRPEIVGLKMSGRQALILLAFIAIPATNVANLLGNVIAIVRGARASAVFGLMLAFTLILAGGGGVFLAGLRGYYLGNLSAVVLVAFAAIYFLARREGLFLRWPRRRLIESVKRNREVIRFSSSIYVTAFSTPLVYLIARYAVLRKGGFELAGILQSAMSPGIAITTILRPSIALFLMPGVNRPSPSDLKIRETARFTRALSVAIVTLALPMVMFPKVLLHILYTRGFVIASPFVYLFVLEEAVGLIAGSNQALLIGLDHIGVHVAICLIGQTALAAMAVWLVPRLGVGGAAAAFLCNGILIFTLTTIWIRRNHGLLMFESIGWLPWLALGVVAIVGVLTVRITGETPTTVLLKLSLYLCVVLLLVRVQQGAPFYVIARRLVELWRRTR